MTVIKCFVCEDLFDHRKSVVKCIEKVRDNSTYHIEIVMQTGDPDEILNYLSKNNNELNVYFIDINLGKRADGTPIDGIKLAQDIREYDPRGFIVIVTAYVKHAHRALLSNIEALDFISKADFASVDDRIAECIHKIHARCFKSVETYQDAMALSYAGKTRIIRYYKILCLETTSGTDHGMTLRLTNEVIQFRGTMKEEEGKLDERFFKISQSSIINMDYISEYDEKRRTVTLVDLENAIPVARSQTRRFKQKLEERYSVKKEV